MGDDRKKAFFKTLNSVLWKIQELEATLQQYNGNQELLHSHLNAYTEELERLYSLRDAINVSLPVELLKYVDEGGNPDDYTVNFFHRANRGNQLAKGKSEAFVAFRDALLKEATEAFPEGCAEYLKLRPELSGEAGGFAGPQGSQGAASQPPA